MFAVLDCEAVDTMPHNDNKAHPETSLVYDVGYLIADNSGVITCKRSFANAEVLFNRELMSSAYYANKLPQYLNSLNTEWAVARFIDIWRTFTADCKTHHVKNIYAYNSRYDEQALNNTIKNASYGFRSFFTPYGVKWRDVWDIAGSTICATKKYVNWCTLHGYVSEKGNPQTSAETVYKYITDNLCFEERHTALNDAEIELEILLAAKKRKKALKKTRGQGWREAAKIAREIREQK